MPVILQQEGFKLPALPRLQSVFKAYGMRPGIKIKGRESWGHGLKVRYLPSMCEALGSISSTTITITKRSLALKTLTGRNMGIRSKTINRKSCYWPLEWLASVDKKMQLSGLERWFAQELRLFSDLPGYLNSVLRIHFSPAPEDQTPSSSLLGFSHRHMHIIKK